MDQKAKIRIDKAINAIEEHNPSQSYISLIDNNKNIFNGLKFIYSDNLENENYLGFSLMEKDEKIQTLENFFYGDRLYFYPKKNHKKIMETSLGYCLFIDSNAAGKILIWEKGGSLSSEEEKLIEVVRFIKEKKLRYNYSFFMLENYQDIIRKDNDRPLETIRALIRFESLVYKKNTFDVNRPEFKINRGEAEVRAREIISQFLKHEDEIQIKLNTRKWVNLLLLKAVLLVQNKKTDLFKKLDLLVEFSLDVLGKFAKTEIYYCWKYLKYRSLLRFFDKISQLNNRSIKEINGMAWDIYSVRVQGEIACEANNDKFILPFFLTFDKKFAELRRACNIRAMVFDENDKSGFSVYLDQNEFHKDLDNSLSKNTQKKLNDNKEIIKRYSYQPSSEYLDREILKLENEIELLIR